MQAEASTEVVGSTEAEVTDETEVRCRVKSIDGD
jgi:hypothetical protein